MRLEQDHKIDPDHLNIHLHSPYPMSIEGGVQDHLHNLSKKLTNLGHHITIFAPEYGDRQEQAKVVHLGRAVPIKAEGTVAIVAINPFRLKEILRIIRRNPADVDHYHEPEISIPSLEHLYLSKAPVKIVTFHAVKERIWLYRAWIPLGEVYKNKHDGRTVVSEAAFKWTQSLYPGEYETIPNGVDTTTFHPDKPKIERFLDGKTNILYLGRLEKRKKVNCLLDAFRIIKVRFPNTRLIIAGSGPLLNHYKENYQNLEDVVFEGRISEEEKPSYYSTADICCFPAMYGESFGIVLIEAMASGKPIVAGKNPGYSSVIDDGYDGYLMDSENRWQLAGKIGGLVENEEKRKQMGSRGRVKAVTRYDWSQVAQRYLDFYLRVLNKKVQS